MKKEVTIVPKDKCPLDVIAELGERTKSAWIYLHENVVFTLKKSCDNCYELARCIELSWDTTENSPNTTITIGTSVIGCWKPVYSIEAEDIPFKWDCDSEEIFFFKMDE